MSIVELVTITKISEQANREWKTKMWCIYSKVLATTVRIYASVDEPRGHFVKWVKPNIGK